MQGRMAADNMRVTRSMAAAVRDASSPLKSGTEVKHEEQVVSLLTSAIVQR